MGYIRLDLQDALTYLILTHTTSDQEGRSFCLIANTSHGIKIRKIKRIPEAQLIS